MTACRHAYPIDRVGTLTATQPKLGLKKDNHSTLKTYIKRLMVVSALASTAATPMAFADATPNQINAYRVYAHERIFNFDQFICFDKLIVRESHYNDVATNGNHYGLAQGIYKPLLRMSGYQQIDWAIAYIQRRYTNSCNALKHSYRYGWY